MIGTRPVRHDGVDKVTGRAQFGADFHPADLLYGFVVRSPHAHARISLRIDTSKAAAFPGVRAVVTAADFPESADRLVELGEGQAVMSATSAETFWASGKVLYKGHAVAAVAATSLHVAEEAASLIEVEYEVLTYVLTAPEAMKEGAPILHEELKMKEGGKPTDKVGNATDHFHFTSGDIAKGFEEADVIVEREYNTASVHQGYIEPQNATAFWSSDGRLLIWCSTQGSFAVRDTTAPILDFPVSRVRVTPMEIGGGFAGRFRPPLARCCIAVQEVRAPRKNRDARKDVFEGTGPTPGSYIKVKMGATKDGRITAAQAYMAYEAGACLSRRNGHSRSDVHFRLRRCSQR